MSHLGLPQYLETERNGHSLLLFLMLQLVADIVMVLFLFLFTYYFCFLEIALQLLISQVLKGFLEVRAF